MSDQPNPVNVAIVNDYPLVVAGITHMLDQDSRIAVLEHTVGQRPSTPVEIVLFDAFASGQNLTGDIEKLLRDPDYDKVVIYSWNLAAAQVQDCLSLGVHGYLGKTLSAQEVADALIRIREGERVVSPEIDIDSVAVPDWPGRDAGLSPREAEVIALITQGMTNEDIAQYCFLSINSVKSYIRSAYRKMGVERRSQAVLWGVQNGFNPPKESSQQA